MINATVSHEMRTPLNSIISQNLGTHFNHKQIKRIISEIGKVAGETKMRKLNSLVKCLEEVTH
jgi:signal transduction histidine kinase